MKLSYLKTHWTPEESHSLLSFLEAMRDTLWQTYGNEIIEFYERKDQQQDQGLSSFIEDDPIPF